MGHPRVFSGTFRLRQKVSSLANSMILWDTLGAPPATPFAVAPGKLCLACCPDR